MVRPNEKMEAEVCDNALTMICITAHSMMSNTSLFLMVEMRTTRDKVYSSPESKIIRMVGEYLFGVMEIAEIRELICNNLTMMSAEYYE